MAVVITATQRRRAKVRALVTRYTSERDLERLVLAALDSLRGTTLAELEAAL
jgi:hypothetical protein